MWQGFEARQVESQISPFGQHTERLWRLSRITTVTTTQSFHAQLRRRVQHTEESLQEFSAAIDHLADQAYVNSDEQYTSREAVQPFAKGVRGKEIRIQLLVGARGQ
jgi:hypothetical protein